MRDPTGALEQVSFLQYILKVVPIMEQTQNKDCLSLIFH